MNRLTAKAGMASVTHKPIAKNSKKRTYNCESVNGGSLRSHVNTDATTADPKKEITDLVLFFFSLVTVVVLFI